MIAIIKYVFLNHLLALQVTFRFYTFDRISHYKIAVKRWLCIYHQEVLALVLVNPNCNISVVRITGTFTEKHKIFWNFSTLFGEKKEAIYVNL